MDDLPRDCGLLEFINAWPTRVNWEGVRVPIIQPMRPPVSLYRAAPPHRVSEGARPPGTMGERYQWQTASNPAPRPEHLAWQGVSPTDLFRMMGLEEEYRPPHAKPLADANPNLPTYEPKG